MRYTLLLLFLTSILMAQEPQTGSQNESVTSPAVIPQEVKTPQLVTPQQSAPTFKPLNKDDTTAAGTLVINPSPQESEVYLNGILVGSGSQTISNLTPGTYLISGKYKGKTASNEITVAPGIITEETISPIKSVRMFIAPSYGMTFFEGNNDTTEWILGPSIEIGVTLQQNIFISQFFHWGIWSADEEESYGYEDFAFGSNLKIQWQKMLANDHLGIFLGAGFGFYEVQYNSAYDSTSYSSNTDYRDYFGGPCGMILVGGPLVYGMVSYDLQVGNTLGHVVRAGIAAYW